MLNILFRCVKPHSVCFITVSIDWLLGRGIFELESLV